MPARRVEITVSEEMWNAIDAARGEMPRAAWIKQALRLALDTQSPAERLAALDRALVELRTALATTDTGTDAV